ncbi:uncharacterized protein BX663DRAFT_492310 [Cokeromyces recurvatus]|uniref:uncharacterized protein n=1 Tax=Cokeromyces recurvatus TaxID=90255 RepID=UPI00221F913E|nr:uncharacterized protein BX663DRAFT_492310 [Cokeromyces recurvatus]KAI7907887.1 hypothetical protein BX663DRAFT_492310 [Cokeromyces recurvatus]
MSIPSNTAFQFHFNNEHNTNNSFEEIDERLFDSYLDISGNKSISDYRRSSSDEENELSQRVSAIGTGRKSSPRNSLKRYSKSNKKEDLESDNDSLIDKSKKSPKTINKKSPVMTPQEVATTTTTTTAETEKKQKSLYKTELCRNWEETQHCRYGVKCQYAHGPSDLREVDRHPKYKTQKCRTFHQTGSCPYGSRCTFRHFNLPGDALEMKKLEKEDEKKKEQEASLTLPSIRPEQQPQFQRSSIFSTENQKVLQQNWFFDNSILPIHTNNSTFGNDTGSLFTKRMMPTMNNQLFDSDDSLLPSNAESLLPHQLLFDLESPDEDEKQQHSFSARCPLRNYVNLPSLSNFQIPHPVSHNFQQQQQQQQPQPQQIECKSFFRPWLF